MAKRTRYFLRFFLLLSTSVVLASCSINTKDYSEEEMRETATSLMEKLTQGQEKITMPLTLHEAQARALKYNMQMRLRLIEENSMEQQLDISMLRLLPEMMISGAVNRRSNVAASRSTSVQTGAQSLEFSTSTDQTRRTADLSATWNILNLGIGYVDAKQRSDRKKISREQKRIIIESIIRDVTSAYYRNLIAQEMMPRIEEILLQSDKSLRNIKNAQNNQLISIVDSLRYQDVSLDLVNQLKSALYSFRKAKIELAALINVPPSTDFTIMGNLSDLQTLPTLHASTSSLEDYALAHRPEIKETLFQERIDRGEIAKVWLNMLPSVSGTLGQSYSSDSNILLPHWSNIGLQVATNVLSPILGAKERKIAKNNVELAQLRRQALAIAILTQVNIARVDFEMASDTIGTYNDIAKVKQSIYEFNLKQRRAGMLPKHGAAADAANALLAEINRHSTYAEIHNSHSRIMTSIGMDILPADIATSDIDTLAHLLYDRRERLSSISNSDLE